VDFEVLNGGEVQPGSQLLVRLADPCSNTSLSVPWLDNSGDAVNALLYSPGIQSVTIDLDGNTLCGRLQVSIEIPDGEALVFKCVRELEGE